MSQSVVKRQRRLAKAKAILQLRKHIDWCKQNVMIRDEQGVESVITDAEALEFIILTCSKVK